MHRNALLFALLALASCAATHASRPFEPAASAHDGPVRAMWVTRFDYKTRADVERIVANCADAGVTTLLFQVRGNATAFYRSRWEPWAEQFGFKDPGFDPLQVALDAAHARGIALHAWVNVMPAWWGTKPPAEARQLWNARPEWMWFDQHEKRQALSERFYVSVNPCLPEVREYLVEVVRDLATEYAVDGVHLDYVRYPSEPPATPKGSDSDWTRDARTVGLFRGETGLDPATDKAAWDAWRAKQITTFVRDLRGMLRDVRPAAQLTAAVGPSPAEHVQRYFQDAATWVREGLVDAVYPMNYAADLATFEKRCANWDALGRDVPVVMGVMLNGKDPAALREQIAIGEKRFAGWSLFAYALVWESPGDALEPLTPDARRHRDELRAWLLPALDSSSTAR